MSLKMDPTTILAIAAILISLISLGLSITEFYLRRQESRPNIKVSITSMWYDNGNQQISRLYIHLFNMGEKPIYIAKLVFTVEPIGRIWKVFPRRKFRIASPAVPIQFESPDLEGDIDYNELVIYFDKKHRSQDQILLTKEAFKLEPQQHIELRHHPLGDNLKVIASGVKPGWKGAPIAYGYVIAYDGTMKAYKSNPTLVGLPGQSVTEESKAPDNIPVQPQQNSAQQSKSKIYPMTSSKS